MKVFIKNIIPNFILEYVYDFFLFHKYRKLTKKNSTLPSLRKNKRAFLLATGPSIKQEDLRLLKNEDTFSLSNFFLHKDIKIIKPKLHFIAPYHKPLVLSNYIEWLKLADKKLPPSTDICLGHTTKKFVDKHKIFSKREVYYLVPSPIRTSPQVDITKPILSPQSGPLMILPALIYMGYTEIYLLGCDSNVLKYYGGKTENFYSPKDDVRINSTDGKAWSGIISIHENSLKMFRQYEKYLKTASKASVKLINLSSTSWIDFIPQDNLPNVLKISNKH